MTPYAGEAKIVGPVQLRVDVRIDDLDSDVWRGEVVETGFDLAAEFKAGYVTVILVDDALDRLAGAIIQTTDNGSLVLRGDERFA